MLRDKVKHDTSKSKVVYDYVEGNYIKEDYICSVCREPLHDPVVEPKCGIMFCRSCLSTWFKRSSECPQCRTRTTMKNLHEVPRFIKNELDSLKVLCPNCSKPHERSNLASHIQDCPIPCELCQMQINPKDKKTHESICPKRIVPCPAADVQCPWTGERQRLETHATSCFYVGLRPTLSHLHNKIEQQDKEMSKQIEIIKLIFRELSEQREVLNNQQKMIEKQKKEIAKKLDCQTDSDESDSSSEEERSRSRRRRK
eukprot:TRINITY_DN1001_c0_g1_i1.p1 TRINITY_DN1001_c0_g1~~TRINITY_DN1001_c0_g1_i1.p1  ORF type:complete len:256 (-),score=25.15 TRINITY_DN1001_c0_g1_i1:48-815(-)